ncbi:MAG: choice-of-anchor I family protein [bacterium]|nr:choice-of-anchor I family protein [bacterium]
MNKKQAAALMIAAAMTAGAFPSVYAQTTVAVSSLTLQPGATEESVNVTWYAEGEPDSVIPKISMDGVEYAASVSDTTIPTGKDSASDPYAGYVVCKATIDSLKPDTVYTYKLSNDNGESWTEDYTYKTPKSDSFRFAFTSDPQIKENGESNSNGWNPSDGTNQTGWQAMMKKIADEGATLIVSAGDQVEDQSWGKKSEYDAFFAPAEMASIAYAPAVGNHDRHYMFRDHFNLPNEMKISADASDDPKTLTEVKTTFRGQNNGSSLSHGNYTAATAEEISSAKNEKGVIPDADGRYDYVERREMETEGNYYYLYNNVLFVTLNTGAYPGGNDALDGENTELESAKAENEAVGIVENFRKTLSAATEDYNGQYNWIVVTHHKSTQTVAKHAADSDIENYVDAGFEQLMEDFDVDFVLGGHDHVYSRSYVLNGSGERVSERLDIINDPEGTIYITGNCASDMQYYTPFEKVDKENNIDYPLLANGERGSQAYLKGAAADNQADYLPIGNQEYNQEYSPCYVMFDVTGDTISAKAYNLDGDSENPASKQVDAFTVTKNKDGGEQSEGFENGSAALKLTQLARYDSGMTNADGGVMEIVDYNAETGWAYAINGQAGILSAIPLKKLEDTEKIDLLDGNDIDVKSLVNDETFIYGDMTSLAISPDGTRLAAAVQAESYSDKGRVALFTCNDDGTLTFEATIETGVQPDMVTFTPDGAHILTADEGEPREGYTAPAIDPKGSVTIIDTSTLTPSTISFDAFSHDTLAAAGVVLKKGAEPAAELEPEYIAADNSKAYITLQEANAVAVLDIAGKAFTGVYPLGTVDFGDVKVDLNKGDTAYNPDNYENVLGLRMPDGISTYEANGKTYIITANEGDSREWGEKPNQYTNEVSGKLTSVSGAETGKKVTYLDNTDYDGLEADKTYLFGTRTFTVFEVTENGLTQVYDSGSDFESKTAQYLPDYFNCSNDSLDIDDRSNKKGPEPESVVTGTIDGRTYAFVTLERIGGVMVYDITDPENVEYVNYINSRDFDAELGADDSPEGLKFVPSEKSPTGNALLLAACEVGGTVAVYELTENSDMDIKITDCRYDTETKKLQPEFNVITGDNDEETVIAAIYNTNGMLVKVLTEQKSFASAGENTAEIDVSSIPAGAYIYKIMVWNNLPEQMPKAAAYSGSMTISQ